MATYGYVRVSSADQNETRQIDAMVQAGIDRGNLFIDKKSGATFDRPAWKRLRRKLKTGGPGGTDPGEYVAVNMSLCVKSWCDILWAK